MAKAMIIDIIRTFLIINFFICTPLLYDKLFKLHKSTIISVEMTILDSKKMQELLKDRQLL